MGQYVDGFVLPVPRRRRAEYVKMARLGAKVFMEHGALAYCESVADDVAWGKRTSFPRSVKLGKNEEVWLSWIVFKSRKHRDQVNAKAMKDPRFAPYMDMKKLPFDARRMFYGGFKTLVQR